jgi:hypothetical protein
MQRWVSRYYVPVMHERKSKIAIPLIRYTRGLTKFRGFCRPNEADIQHGYGHAAWQWTLTMDLDMKHGLEHGHAVWTWTLDTQYGHGHAAWTRISAWTSTCFLTIFMLQIHILAACPSTCCMSQNMLRVYVGAACRLFMPEARAIAARTCPCPCCISMFMSMLHVSPFSMGMGMLHRRGHIARTGHAAWTLIRSMNINMDTDMNSDMGMVKTWT